MLGGIVVLAGAVIRIEVAAGESPKNWSAERSTDSGGRGTLVSCTATQCKVDVFLIRLPGFSSQGEEIAQMLRSVLVRGACPE